jgi:acetoin utilization deacetylase AcuC-like enzyme
MTLVYYDDRFLRHKTGSHPECPQRLRAIHARLEESGLLKRCEQHTVVAAADEDILRVHPERHLTHLREFARAGGGRIEVDTVMSIDSADVAILAAGAAVDAVSKVVGGDDCTALCLVRPPGHHAVPDAAMGFCLLGNAAIAARTAVQRLGLDRVLVVDWDVHHGNGTQEVFYEDEQVGFFSVHRFPFYPGTGRLSETGRGPGLGTTFNLPLEFGISRLDYLSAFESTLTRAADAIKPDLIIVSAGFDAHADDPVGSLGLQTEDFQKLTELVLQVADTHCSGRLVSILEGGYNIERLADCVEVHLQAMLDHQRHV